MSVDPGKAEDSVVFPPVETHFIRSRFVAQTFRIDVAMPPGRRGDSGPLPVVYVTDGNLGFRMFKEISWSLQTFGIHPFPRFILVGIGYPSELQYAGLLLRCRDFNSAERTRPDMGAIASASPAAVMEGLLPFEEGTKDYGGAEDFLQFIQEELIPFVDQTYPTIPDERTLFGHSGGGFLTLLALFTRPQLFKNYIASSPGLFMSRHTPGRPKDDHQDYGFVPLHAFLASDKSLEGISLYMSIGTEEDFQPLYFGKPPRDGEGGTEYYGAYQLTSTFFRMVSLLKHVRVRGLNLMVEAFPGEVHMTVYPMAFIHGVQAVFGMRRIPGIY